MNSRQTECQSAGLLQAQYPCVLECFDKFTHQARNKRIAVFLDYDGMFHVMTSSMAVFAHANAEVETARLASNCTWPHVFTCAVQARSRLSSRTLTGRSCRTR